MKDTLMRTFCPGLIQTLPVPETGFLICGSWVGWSYCVACQVTYATFGDLIVMTGVELTGHLVLTANGI